MLNKTLKSCFNLSEHITTLLLNFDKSLAKHNSHLFLLLSRSCRTECAVWHSYTSQTLLLLALWWTPPLPSGHPVSPKQTAVNHSDSTNYTKGYTATSVRGNRMAFIMDKLVTANTVVLHKAISVFGTNTHVNC